MSFSFLTQYLNPLKKNTAAGEINRLLKCGDSLLCYASLLSLHAALFAQPAMFHVSHKREMPFLMLSRVSIIWTPVQPGNWVMERV